MMQMLSSCKSTSRLGSTANNGYRLVWSDEFEGTGLPDSNIWNFEKGFVRNLEDQWYQTENAWQANGKLIIEARREKKPNPNFEKGSMDWQTNREWIEYTSGSINTKGNKQFTYGRFEIRARFETRAGLWPAFWTLGVDKEWPSNGEIDIMEYYKGNLLANVALGTTERWKAKWFDSKYPVANFNDPEWENKFHTFRLDWTESELRFYVDDFLLNRVSQDSLVNPDGFKRFQQHHYILLNFAVGGINGGDPSATSFPQKYEIDYVRVFQQKKF